MELEEYKRFSELYHKFWRSRVSLARSPDLRDLVRGLLADYPRRGQLFDTLFFEGRKARHLALEMGISVSRVCQIRDQALRVLTHPRKMRVLAEALSRRGVILDHVPSDPTTHDLGVLETPIDELQLSVRAYTTLKSANIQTVGQLAGQSERELLKTKHFGWKTIQELKKVLSSMGLSFSDSESHPVH